MEKRIGIAAGILAVAPAVGLGIFEVMGWTMTPQIAVTLLIITGITEITALGVLSHGVWLWSKPMRSRYGWRWPLYRRDKPNPHQGLIDMAKLRQGNPITHLVITDRIIMRFDRDDARPYIRLRISYANLGLNQVLVGDPEGYAYFGSTRLPEYIRDMGGKHQSPAGHTGSGFDIDVYIPPEILKNLCDEVDSASGEVRSIDFRQVSAKVRVEVEGAPVIPWILGAHREIFRPNR